VSIFADADIIATVRRDFVPVAIDVWYEQRRRDEAGEFFYQVVDQGRHKGKDRVLTRQGLYCLTADGVLLADKRHCSPEQLRCLLNLALTRFRLGMKTQALNDSLASDQRYHRQPPQGGRVVDVFGKILLEGAAMQEALRIATRNAALSRDHLWITASEVSALAPRQVKAGFTYPVPPRLTMRIARFHLVDNSRGEPPMWKTHEIRALRMNLKVVNVEGEVITLKLTGFVNLATDCGSRTYTPTLLGELVYNAKKRTFERFDVVALGKASGEGPHTPGCPQGKFSLAISFTLANMREVASHVPPPGCTAYGGLLVWQLLVSIDHNSRAASKMRDRKQPVRSYIANVASHWDQPRQVDKLHKCLRMIADRTESPPEQTDGS